MFRTSFSIFIRGTSVATKASPVRLLSTVSSPRHLMRSRLISPASCKVVLQRFYASQQQQQLYSGNGTRGKSSQTQGEGSGKSTADGSGFAYLGLGVVSAFAGALMVYQSGVLDIFLGKEDSSDDEERAEENLDSKPQISANTALKSEEITSSPSLSSASSSTLKEVVEDSSKTKNASELSTTAEKMKKGSTNIAATYVLVGAGTASFAALKAIMSRDRTARILIIGDENEAPYMRTPLSKEMWFSNDELTNNYKFTDWNGRETALHYRPREFYETVEDLLQDESRPGVALLTGHRVVSLDTLSKQLTLDDGRIVEFEKLLLATGGQPKSLAIFDKAEDSIRSHVTLFRKIEDFKKLYSLTREGKSFAVIGGGFLGSELACALAQQQGAKSTVAQIFPEQGNMGKVFPRYLSDWTTEQMKSLGVDVRNGVSIAKINATADGKVEISLQDSETGEAKGSVSADHVVVAVGLQPDTSLARSAHLEVDSTFGGIVVNSELEARSDIWVAGDVSCFYDASLNRRRRVEHHDHAVVSGKLAGENMTGARKPFMHQSMFWSDLGPKIGYEALGICDSSLKTVSVWAKASPDTDAPAASSEVSQADRAAAVNESSSAKDANAIQVDASKATVSLNAGDVSGGETKEKPATKSMVAAENSSLDAPQKSAEYGKGVVFYLDDDKVVGIMLWNLFGQIPIARRIIKDDRRFEDLSQLSRLFNLHAKKKED